MSRRSAFKAFKVGKRHWSDNKSTWCVSARHTTPVFRSTRFYINESATETKTET